MADGIAFIAGDLYLRPLTIYASAANLAYSGSIAVTVVFLVRVAGLLSSLIGLLTGTAAGGLLGALTARRLTTWMGTARALIVTTLATSAAGLLIPLTGPRPASCLLRSRFPAGHRRPGHRQRHHGHIPPGLLPGRHARRLPRSRAPPGHMSCPLLIRRAISPGNEAAPLGREPQLGGRY